MPTCSMIFTTARGVHGKMHFFVLASSTYLFVSVVSGGGPGAGGRVRGRVRGPGRGEGVGLAIIYVGTDHVIRVKVPGEMPRTEGKKAQG